MRCLTHIVATCAVGESEGVHPRRCVGTLGALRHSLNTFMGPQLRSEHSHLVRYLCSHASPRQRRLESLAMLTTPSRPCMPLAPWLGDASRHRDFGLAGVPASDIARVVGKVQQTPLGIMLLVGPCDRDALVGGSRVWIRLIPRHALARGELRLGLDRPHTIRRPRLPIDALGCGRIGGGQAQCHTATCPLLHMYC